MTTTPEERAKEIMARLRQDCADAICTYLDCPSCGCMSYLAQAIREAEDAAEQRAIDRCRHIIATAIVSNGDAEAMRRLLLAAFDPTWDKVVSIINPKD